MSSLQQVRWMVFCDCGTSSKGSLAKVQLPSEPGLCPWMCVFSWLSVGRGGGLRHVKEEEHFPVLGHLLSWAYANHTAATFTGCLGLWA